MLDKNIKSLTVDFEDETFVYLHNDQQERVNIVEGYEGDFAEVQLSAKKGLLFDDTSKQIEPTKEEKTTNDKNSSNDVNVDLIATLHKSMLPSIDNLEQNFHNLEAYIQPYEAPGGDFLWYKNYDNGKCLVILGDCTGHGVQGAMIAMSVITLLKQCFLRCPNDLLDTVYQFYDQMADLLEDDNRAGFDSQMGFLLFDTENNSVEYTGNGINMIHKDSTKKITVCHTRYIQLFKRRLSYYKIELFPRDQILIYTDGITDQYDSENRRKLGRKNLREMIYNLTQENTLDDFLTKFNNFRGDIKQMDDQSILVITV